jgi:hypothetical protein
MRTDVYRYTTVWDVKDGIVDSAEMHAPQTDALRLILGDEIGTKEFDVLVKAANAYPRVRVVLSRRSSWAWSRLALFDSLWGVQAHGLIKDSVPYLAEVPDSIKELEIGVNSGVAGATDQLQRFSCLKRLSISGKFKGVEPFSKLSEITELHLHYVSQIDFNSLRAFGGLRDLKVHHGSIAELPSADAFPVLERLNIWRTRGLSRLDWIAELSSLRRLQLGALPNVVDIPDLSHQTALESIGLDQMKGLTSLSALAAAPNLRTLHIKGMNQLDVEDYNAFKNHPSLCALTSGFSSRKKNSRVNELVGKPTVEYGELYQNTKEF